MTINNYEKDDIFLEIEGQYLEYKKSREQLSRDFFETYSDFANTDGGQVILGVDQITGSAGEAQFVPVGVIDPQQQIEDLTRKLTDTNITSSYHIKESEVIFNEPSQKYLIIITIESAEDGVRPVYVKDKRSNAMRAFVRRNSEDIPLDKNAELAMERNRNSDLDSQILKNFSVTDLNLRSINDYRRSISENPKLASHDTDTLEEFLRWLGVINKDFKGDGTEGITVAGALFFGNYNAIVANFPNYQLDLYDNRTSDGSRWQNRISTVTGQLNVYEFFLQSHAYLQSAPTNSFKLNTQMIRTDDVYEQLKIALREALVNSIMHADYFSDEHTKIDIYWDYYDFKNAGKMKIIPDRFFTTRDTKLRNSVLSQFMVHLGFGERGGSGGEQIYAVAKDDALRVPELQTDDSMTELRIWTIDLVASIPDLDANQTIVLKWIFKQNSGTSKVALQEATNLSRYHTDKALKELIDRDIVFLSGSGRSTRYHYKRTLMEQIASVKQHAADLEMPF